MSGWHGHNNFYQGQSPRPNRPPMQYFTSGSDTSGTPPNRFRGSTPNRMGPPRVQNPNFIASPHSSQYNSPYFTSGSDTSGTPQNQFRGSTPNRMGPPRVQNPNFVASPHSSQYSSPYQDRPRPSYFSSPGTPQYTPSPRYTPSPVRARGRATPNTSYSQSPGNSSWVSMPFFLL